MAFTNLSHALPGDVIISILTRLPLNSLLSFRCVCKSWSRVTRDLTFAFKQLSMVTSSPPLDNTYLILAHDWHSCHAQPQLSLLYNGETSAVRSPFRTDENLGRVLLYGPCNGVICLYDYQAASFSLWNPATKETKVVPSSIGRRHPCDIFNMYPKVKTGFGYDPARDDYKLFVITQAFVMLDFRASVLKNTYVGVSAVREDSPQVQLLFAQRVEIYSLNRNEWKFLETNKKLNIESPSSSPGRNYAYLNGFCYWLGCRKNLGSRDDEYSYSNITSFDMTGEEFGEIVVPEDVRRDNRTCWYVQLLVVREHLCLIWQEHHLLNFRVLANKRWMKLHKVITLPFDNFFGFPGNKRRLYDVLMVRDSGDIVLRSFENRLRLYNPSTRKLTNLVFDVSANINEMVYCKESLVRLNGRELKFSS